MGRDIPAGRFENWRQSQPSVVTHWPDFSSFDELQNKNFRNTHLKPINSHPVNWFVVFHQFCEIALELEGLKTHKIGSAATALAQWCTSWSPKLLPLVRTPGVHPRGITYLLVDGLLGVRALRRGPVEAVAACSFFGGFCP